jgi:5-methyltetrahydropteroyltriglutamate--homocysteine methyltransferase
MFGSLDARTTRMESVGEVVAAIRKVTAMVPAERLMVSPSAGLEFLPRSVAKGKLQRLVEATRTADGTLQEVRA